MNLQEYQEEAHKTALYRETMPEVFRPYPWVYAGMKLAGEAGEVSDKFGKIIRDDLALISEERRNDLIDELGDVLWYVAELATILDASLEMVAIRNVKKLEDRSNRGVIQGSGDNR